MPNLFIILLTFAIFVTTAHGAPASGTFPAPFVNRQTECERAQRQAYFDDPSLNAFHVSRTEFSRAEKKFNEETEAARAKGVADARLPRLYTHGKPTRGVAVLIHGISESPEGMKELAEIYQEQGFNVVTVLLEGHGTTPEDLAKVTDVGVWQRQIDQAIKTAHGLGDEVLVGGYSFGGSLALNAYERNPDLVQAVSMHATVVKYKPGNANIVRGRAAAGEFWTSGREPEEGPIYDQYRYRRTPTAPFILTDNFVRENRRTWLTKKIPVPIYVVSAPRDNIADPSGTEAFIKAQDIPPERQLVIPRGRHPDANRSSNIDFDSYGLPEFIGSMLPK